MLIWEEVGGDPKYSFLYNLLAAFHGEQLTP